MAYEDRPEKDTPDWIRQELREYGGVSPDGQAIWRLVLAQNCRIQCSGELNRLPPGLDVEQMGDDAQPTDVTPLGIEVGTFWVPRYELTGWILQRWYPGVIWGTRQTWESERAPDGRTRLMAAYPQRGDYLMMPCGPWKAVAEAGDLKAAIRCYNAQQRRNPVNWANFERARIAFEQQQRQQAVDAYAEEIAAQHRMGVAGTLRHVSESAQRFRNAVAQQSAGGVNLGASEKWGS